MYLSHNGPQNPILIIQAPMLNPKQRVYPKAARLLLRWVSAFRLGSESRLRV